MIINLGATDRRSWPICAHSQDLLGSGLPYGFVEATLNCDPCTNIVFSGGQGSKRYPQIDTHPVMLRAFTSAKQ